MRLRPLLLALALSSIACPRGGDKGAAGKPGLKIGLVTDVGGRGDESFNDGALRGLEMWVAGKKYTAGGYQPLGDADFQASIPPDLKTAPIAHFECTPVVLQAKAQEDYEPDLDLLVGEKVDLAVGVGFMLENAVEAAAKKHPQSRFLLIDSPILDSQNKPYLLPNVMTVVFRENEGSFLAGALAGIATKTGKVGFVGGMEIPLIKKFEAGFLAGVKTVNPQAAETAKRVYTGSFDDPTAGKRLALELYNQGVDVIFHAAGHDGLGVIQAAKEQDKLVIGVDSDQAHLAPKNVLTSMVKRVDYAVYLAARSVKDGKFTAGDTVLGLKAGGVGLAPVGVDFPGKEAALAKVEALKKQIVAGKLAVPATIDEYKKFTPPPSEQ